MKFSHQDRVDKFSWFLMMNISHELKLPVPPQGGRLFSFVAKYEKETRTLKIYIV